MHKMAKTLTATAAFLALGGALANPVAAATSDAWITTKAKLALLSGEGSAMSVNVDTMDGRVTLHGKVPTAQEKNAAETAVKKIEGVKSVRNLLQIVPEAQADRVDTSDDKIRNEVQDALKAEAALKDSDIAVQSVNKGVVLLGGQAESLTDHLAAVEIAAGVSGVRDVASEIKSPDSLADDEIWKDTRTEAGDTPDDASSPARDVWVTSAAKMMLLTDADVPALDINIDTRGGVVTLFGIVPSQEAKAKAESNVMKVAGVKRVVNDLQIVPESKQEAVQASDEDTQKRLNEALDKHAALNDVDVEVKAGIARLTGTVNSGSDRLEAAIIARSTKGVRAVQDDLTLSN